MQILNTDNASEGLRLPLKTYKRNIVWYNEPNSYTILQIYKKGLEYALVSDKYQQCHQFVWCKDFLHDVVHATVNNFGFELYGFLYSPLNDPKPCLKEIRLLISNSKDKKLASLIPSCVDFLNQIEARIKMSKTIVRKVANPQCDRKKTGVFLFQGNSRWLMSPPMLSLYTWLIRIGLCHKIGTSFKETIKALKEKTISPYQVKDAQWIKDCEVALHKIIRLGDKKIFYRDIKMNYPESLNIDEVHNRLGILSYSFDIIVHSLKQKVPIPYWHRLR